MVKGRVENAVKIREEDRECDYKMEINRAHSVMFNRRIVMHAHAIIMAIRSLRITMVRSNKMRDFKMRIT